jgi:predicted sugar kinase
MFQHGAFASERSHRLVEQIRAYGVEGVGQSSWGPTIFALTPDETAARKLVEFLRTLPEAAESDLIIAAAQNRGALIKTE